MMVVNEINEQTLPAESLEQKYTEPTIT